MEQQLRLVLDNVLALINERRIELEVEVDEESESDMDY